MISYLKTIILLGVAAEYLYICYMFTAALGAR